MPWINRPAHEYEKGLTKQIWEHPGYAARERAIAAGTLDPGYTACEITFTEGGRVPDGWAKFKTGGSTKWGAGISRSSLYENPELASYYKDWCAGKITIPGLKVSIKDAHGNEWGPSTCKIVEKVKNKGKSDEISEVISATFSQLKKVKLV